MSSHPSENAIEWVSPKIIRQIFNELKLLDQVKEGKIKTKLKRNSHPTNPPPPGEPYCTFSQIVFYYEETGKPIAIVHQYLRPDGTIGASGKPDPKRLFLPDRIVSIRSTPKK